MDLRRATLTVRHSLTRLPGRRYVLTEPKTERSRRTIPLLPPVVEALTELRKRQLAADLNVNQGLVFCDEEGRAQDGSLVTKRFQRTLEAAGLPKVTFHSIRHACATMLIENGVDLATVAAILGHSTIVVTTSTYDHVRGNRTEKALGTLLERIR